MPAGLARQQAPLTGFGNILVHEDLAVDWVKVDLNGDCLEDLERIAEFIRRWLAHRAPSDDDTSR